MLLSLFKQTAWPASRTPKPLVQRRVRFDWSKTTLDWIPDHPFASDFINEINLLLPAGEFWFCRVYNQALPYVTDAKLREDMQQFIKQEAMHARAHGAAVKDYLNHHGIETDSNTQKIEKLFELLLSDTPLGLALPKTLEKTWLVFRLGIIAAVEHMTCVLGNYILENRQWDAAGADATLLDLLRWHGAEEVEHRSVAFDVYRHLGGGYLSRYYLAGITMPAIFALWVHGAAHLMRQDKKLAHFRPSVFRPWIWRRWYTEAKTGLLPDPFWIVGQELSYFSPWYDPLSKGSGEQAAAYLAQSPAARRALSLAG